MRKLIKKLNLFFVELVLVAVYWIGLPVARLFYWLSRAPATNKKPGTYWLETKLNNDPWSAY